MADLTARFQGLSTRAKMGLALLLGMMGALGHAPWGLWWLTLLVLVGLAILLESTRDSRQALWLGWAAGTGWFGLTLNWIVEPFLVDIARHGWMAPFALLFLAGGLALFWALAFGLARRFGGARHAALLLVVMLPLTELIRAYIFTGFPWGMMAYVWLDLPVMQLAALIGPHGVNVVTLLMTVGVWWLTGTGKVQAVIVGLLIWGGVFAAWALIGLLPVTPPSSETQTNLRLIQPNAPQHQKWEPEHIPTFWQRHLKYTGEPGNPDLIIWPETAVPSLLENADRALAAMSEAAGDTPVIFGIQRRSEAGYHNTLAAIDGTGRVTQIYDKHHLVPFGEYLPFGNIFAALGIHGLAADQGHGFAPGQGPEVLDFGALGNVLPLICYEAVFPHDLRTEARADWILQITNDAWFGEHSGPYQHLAQAQFRAVEQGLPLVRVANTGVSAVINAGGQIIASLPLGEEGYLDVPLPTKTRITLYSKTGDLPLTLLLIGLASVAALKSRLTSRRGGDRGAS